MSPVVRIKHFVKAARNTFKARLTGRIVGGQLHRPHQADIPDIDDMRAIGRREAVFPLLVKLVGASTGRRAHKYQWSHARHTAGWPNKYSREKLDQMFRPCMKAS